MAIDFPNSPTLNQTYTVGSKTWIYDGEKWLASSSSTTSDLDSLTDVVITSPLEYESLVYDGANWVNKYASNATYVRNAEATTLTTGTVVYLFGATGDHATVKRADNDSDATSSKTVGLVAASIAASENGPVVTRGYVDGIDLSTGYTSGDILWLAEDGGFTKTKPSAPEHLVFVGVVVRATNNGIIYVATQNGYELDELHDVSITDKTSGDFLKYNGTLWVNDPINLGTDTTGNYMSDVTAGNLITVTHTPGEGSSAAIAVSNGASGQIIVANATGVPTFTTISGDITVSNTGVVTIQANSVALGTDTTGDYVSSLVAGTGVSLANNSGESATPTISIGQAVGTTNNVTFNDLIVSGNLTVNGTTTTINSTTLNVDDINIELGSVASPTDVTAAGGGITLKGATDKTITWNASNGWSSSEDLNIASGKIYRINGTSVLSSTTLGSGVTGSSLTSVGTIATGVWQGTVITGQYGGTGVINTGKTITLGGNLTTSGAFTTTFTATANTSITLPTTGTLATLAGSEALTNKSINGLTITSSTGTLTVTNAKTLAVSNTLTFTGTDSSSVAFGAGGTVLYSGGALGTPSSATLTSATGLPISTGVSGLGANVATFLATPSSSNLRSAMSDETGSGLLVFATSPALTTPNIGVATGTSFNSITGLSSTTPLVDGTAAVGTGTTTARGDHVHPTDTSRAPLASPTFTGTVGIPMPLFGYSTTATAAGTTTLVNTSNYTQFFTGTTTQTVVLPVANTMTLGQSFVIHNNSTGSLTVNTSAGTLVATVTTLARAHITCILASGTTAASWDVGYITASSGSHIVSATAPVSPSADTVWFNSDNGRTYIWYNDGNTTQWVEFGNANIGPTGATGATGPVGLGSDLYLFNAFI